MPKNLYDRVAPNFNSNTAKRWADDGIKNIQIFTCEDELTCDSCKQNHEKIISVRLAQDSRNVPPWSTCTCKQGCRCIIKPLVDVSDL